ncbi:MAG TPA: nitroreductase [Ramlibacter sp.]|nr:nitroreductase [Ramlibacter sp.]
MAHVTDARVQSRYAGDPESAQWAASLIQHRQTILPKRLVEPGPDVSQLELIFAAAAAAPDHGELVPWRFVVIPAGARGRLAAVFAASLLERDPCATAQQVEQAREKAFRAPVLMLAVVDAGSPGGEIPATERILSAGCAIQNMLLVATSQGFGSALTGGKALHSRGLRALFSLRACEQAVCFVSIGTAQRRKPPRQRPEPSRYISFLSPPG